MASLTDDDGAVSVDGAFDAEGTAVLRIAGEIDLASTAAVEAQVSELCRGASKVVVDLSDVTFMDSSGLAMLLRTRESVGDVTIVAASRTVARVVQAAGLSEVLHLDA
jgi:anti-anti-sigma factor